MELSQEIQYIRGLAEETNEYAHSDLMQKEEKTGQPIIVCILHTRLSMSAQFLLMNSCRKVNTNAPLTCSGNWNVNFCLTDTECNWMMTTS